MAAAKPLHELTARDIMKTDVVTIPRGASLTELVRLLGEHRVSGLPVTDEAGTVVGVVSARDLLERFAEDHVRPPMRPAGFYDTVTDEELELDEFVAEEEEEEGDTVADIMTGEVFSVSVGASVAEVASAMLEHGVHRLLVQDRKHYVGLLSSFDVLRALSG